MKEIINYEPNARKARLVLVVILSILLYIVVLLLSEFVLQYEPKVEKLWIDILTIILILFCVGYGAFLFYQRKIEYYTIGPEEISVRKGIFFTSIKSYSYNTFESIEVAQSAIGRMFNFGHITISFTNESKLVLREIPNPIDVMHKIRGFMNNEKKQLLVDLANKN